MPVHSTRSPVSSSSVTSPLVSVVTPSFNQAAYLRQTLDSVLGQRGVTLEYVVMDGGSTDGSRSILEQYDEQLAHWVSAPDGGQAQAINAGMAHARGEILGWLNSDDYLLPGALGTVAARLDPARAELVFGNVVHLIEGTGRASGSDIVRRARHSDLMRCDYVIQPAAFWTRRAWERAGPLDDTLHYAFDWEWFIRAYRAGVSFQPLPAVLAVYRLHDAHKTGQGGDGRTREIATVYERHAGPQARRLFERLARSPRARLAARLLPGLTSDVGQRALTRLAFPWLSLRHGAAVLRDMLYMA